jgi:hypothetical protein
LCIGPCTTRIIQSKPTSIDCSGSCKGFRRRGGDFKKEEAETRVRTLEGEMKTLKEEAETRVGTLKGDVKTLKRGS